MRIQRKTIVKIVSSFYVLMLILCISSCTNNNNDEYIIDEIQPESVYPKYIFYFIGDGMGKEHLKLAYYPPIFVDFPYKGELSTNNINNTTTDSAAAGTALASGEKTSNGVLGLKPDMETKLESIMDVAQNMGIATGVTTNVSIDHATPAAFYSHAQSRNLYHEIASWIPTKALTLYAGSGFLDPQNLLNEFTEKGYEIARGINANLNAPKMIWIQDETSDASRLPYAVARRPQDMSLPIIVEKSIDYLYTQGGDNGFVLMAEGGMIDFASHANDAILAKGEVEDLSNAVDVALKFYEQHPLQTLIIVTADHETGGLYFDNLDQPRWKSKGHTSAKVPIYAIGIGAENFEGSMPNHHVALKIKQLLKQRKATQ